MSVRPAVPAAFQAAWVGVVAANPGVSPRAGPLRPSGPRCFSAVGLIAFTNLHRAALKACRGKRDRTDVLRFLSIDHEILKGTLARKIKDPHVLELAGFIIDHANPQDPVVAWFPGDNLFTPLERRRGLPIGNQTSQFFGNVYLDPLDHFLRDHLGVGGYARYGDDLLVFGDTSAELRELRSRAGRFLERFRLELHRDKSVVFPVTQGIPFLGYRVFPTHRLLAKENVRRSRRRLREMQGKAARGRITPAEIRTRIQSWTGHAGQADTYHLRERLFQAFPFSWATAV